MKNILLPTDLTIQSLWPIHKLAENTNGDKLNIHLVHILQMPLDFYELIGIGKSNPHKIVNRNFIEAYEMLHNKHQSIINRISLEFLYGSSKRIILNYMQGRAIDEICMLSDYRYQFNLKQSVDFIRYLKQSEYQINNFPFHVENIKEYQTLSTLLKGNNGLKEIVITNRNPVFSEIIPN